MALTKLTLSADKKLVAAAKRYAAKEGTSLSSLFTRLLAAMLRHPPAKTPPGPLTRKATGLVRLPAGASDRRLIEQALAEKHGI